MNAILTAVRSVTRRVAPPPQPPMQTVRMGSCLNHYNQLEHLGSGVTADVYSAIAPDGQTAVALKRLSASLLTPRQEAQCRELLQRESQILEILNHPAIPSVHDSGQDFVAMQLVFGKTVEQMMDEAATERMAPKTVAHIMKGVLEGLDHAHGKEIVHRDLKPGNIMVGDDGQVYIMDWGMGVKKSEERNRSGKVVGSPAYMSPEQVKGLPVDERADLFSLGVMSFELLFGFNPFERDTLNATLRAVVKDPIPAELLPKEAEAPEDSLLKIMEMLDISSDEFAVPREQLKGVICKLMQKDPKARYQTAAEVLADPRFKKSVHC
jgi:eukaryotic-like serine/threonine-protein kinase